MQRNHYSDAQFNDLPYARALQALRLDEQLRYLEQKDALMMAARHSYEQYISQKGNLTKGTLRGGGGGKKSNPDDALLSFPEWLEYFGYEQPDGHKKPKKVRRTVEEEIAAADRLLEKAIAAFDGGGMQRVDVETLGGGQKD